MRLKTQILPLQRDWESSHGDSVHYGCRNSSGRIHVQNRGADYCGRSSNVFIVLSWNASPSLWVESREILAKRGGEEKVLLSIISRTPENLTLDGASKRRRLYSREEIQEERKRNKGRGVTLREEYRVRQMKSSAFCPSSGEAYRTVSQVCGVLLFCAHNGMWPMLLVPLFLLD